MIDPGEKSTQEPPGVFANEELDADLVLDGRLGLYHRHESWLAVSDLHYGYEVTRRQAGGLWPMWGMKNISERLASLIRTYQPETLILTGDIVDSAAAPEEGTEWLSTVTDFCKNVVLIEGNHDRGAIRKKFTLVPFYRTGTAFFQHGHVDHFAKERKTGERINVVQGHIHPSIRFRDGAGTSLTLPTLVIEEEPDSEVRHFVLPAFSPWAGGVRYSPLFPESRVRQWACSGSRVFEVF